MKVPRSPAEEAPNTTNSADGGEARADDVLRLQQRVRELELELAAHRLSEAARHARERAAQAVMLNIPNLVSLLKPDGTPDLINRQIREYTGRTEDELRNWGASDLVHPDDLERAADTFKRGIRGGERFTITYRMRRQDGTYRWFDAHHQPLRDEAAQLHGWCVSVNDIDDWVRARDALRESERIAHAIVDGIPGFVAMLSPSGSVQLVNRRILEYCGQTLEGLQSWGSNGIVHLEDMPHVASIFGRSIEAGTPYYIEQRLRRFDGVYRWFGNSGVPIKDDSGLVLRWYVLLTDIDEKRRSEDTLRAREVDLRLIINTIPGLICLFTPDGQLEGANQQFLDYVSQTAEEANHWATNGTIHAEDLAHCVAVFGHSVASGEPYDIEARIRRYDGQYRWFQIRGQAHRDAAGRVLRWYGLLTDVDARKRAERALEVSERNLRFNIDTIPVLAWSATIDGAADFFNQHYLDHVGLPIEQMLGWQWTSVVHPDDLEVAARAWERFRASGVGGEAEARVRRHDGVYRWFLFRANPLRDELGNIVKWYGVNTDIEDRKRAEDELRRREYYLAAGEHVSLTGSYAWEVNTGKITCSEQFLRIHEFEHPAEVTTEAMRNRIHPVDHHVLEATMAEIQGGRGNPEHEVRLLMPDGRVKFVRASAQVIHDPDGQQICIGAVQDVTRRRLAEDALDKLRSDVAHRTRVMSLGTLTASIAHELNQPLTGMMTNANTCVRMLTADPPNLAGALETARRTIRDSSRAADVVARLRALFAGKIVRHHDVDLNELVSEVLALLSSDLQRSRAIVQTRLAKDLPMINADRVQLQQVILNLVRNACEAMSNVEDRQRQAVIETTRDGDECVRLNVQDRGVGFDAETGERLFEAFYTTKHSGMGIGLSLSRSIIEGHQGKLWAERREGGGAAFSFTIPIVSQGPTTP